MMSNRSSTDASVVLSNTNPRHQDERSDADEIQSSKVFQQPNYKRDIKVPPNLGLGSSKKEPLTIKVKRAAELSSHSRMYKMTSKPRGKALIINNQEFTMPDMFPFREGADVDADNLENLFSQLGFSVSKHSNMKRTDMMRLLIDFSESLNNDPGDMLIVAILSHGKEHGKIVTSDCLYIDEESDILRKFNNEYCPSLVGKPKFFIIQACRGEEFDYGIASPNIDKRTPWQSRVKIVATLLDPARSQQHKRIRPGKTCWLLTQLCQDMCLTGTSSGAHGLLRVCARCLWS